jgi:hypothetical protein
MHRVGEGRSIPTLPQEGQAKRTVPPYVEVSDDFYIGGVKR